MTRRQALLLRIFSLWTAYVWLVLIWNIWHDHKPGETSIGFKGVHYTLAAISLALAITSWRVVTKVAGKRAVFPRSRARAGTARARAGTAGAETAEAGTAGARAETPRTGAADREKTQASR